MRRQRAHEHAISCRLFRSCRQSRRSRQSRRQLDANGTSSRLERLRQGNQREPRFTCRPRRTRTTRRIGQNHRRGGKKSIRRHVRIRPHCLRDRRRRRPRCPSQRRGHRASRQGSHRQKPRQRGQIQSRQRRRLQIFRRPGHEGHARPGQPPSRKRHPPQAAFVSKVKFVVACFHRTCCS